MSVSDKYSGKNKSWKGNNGERSEDFREVLSEESLEQRIEGGEECAVRLSGGECLEKRDEKRKTPRRVCAWPARVQARGPVCLCWSKGKVTGGEVRVGSKADPLV